MATDVSDFPGVGLRQPCRSRCATRNNEPIMSENLPDSAAATKLRVAVVFGGQSSEHEISCLSASSILRALNPDDFEILAIGIDKEGRWSIQSDAVASLVARAGVLPNVAPSAAEVLPVRSSQVGTALLSQVDVVFPVLHGPFGEDGTIQGLLELAQVPYVGSGVLASAAAMNKVHCKSVLLAHGVQVAPWATVHKRTWQRDREEILAAASDVGFPLFVKPARAGSSVGVSKAKDVASLIAAIDEALTHDPLVLLEASIENAREIEVGVLSGVDGEAQASVPAEIIVREGHEFYDYAAKYLDDAADLVVPAELSEDVTQRIRQTACEVFNILGCEGLARVDFFLTQSGEIIVNEVNTMPGFTNISLFPRMWQASGMDYSMLVNHLVTDALRRGTGLR